MRLKEEFENDVAIWRKHENTSIAPHDNPLLLRRGQGQ